MSILSISSLLSNDINHSQMSSDMSLRHGCLKLQHQFHISMLKVQLTFSVLLNDCFCTTIDMWRRQQIWPLSVTYPHAVLRRQDSLETVRSSWMTNPPLPDYPLSTIAAYRVEHYLRSPFHHTDCNTPFASCGRVICLERNQPDPDIGFASSKTHSPPYCCQVVTSCTVSGDMSKSSFDLFFDSLFALYVEWVDRGDIGPYSVVYWCNCHTGSWVLRRFEMWSLLLDWDMRMSMSTLADCPTKPLTRSKCTLHGHLRFYNAAVSQWGSWVEWSRQFWRDFYENCQTHSNWRQFGLTSLSGFAAIDIYFWRKHSFGCHLTTCPCQCMLFLLRLCYCTQMWSRDHMMRNTQFPLESGRFLVALNMSRIVCLFAISLTLYTIQTWPSEVIVLSFVLPLLYLL